MLTVNVMMITGHVLTVMLDFILIWTLSAMNFHKIAPVQIHLETAQVALLASWPKMENVSKCNAT